MRRLLFLLFLMTAGGAWAQPWPREARFTLDNTKRMTDASVSLFNVHSDYDFPYEIPSRGDVSEKLERILHFLEKATPDGIADAATGERVTDLRRIPERFVFTTGDFRPYSYEWGVTYSGMLRAARATGNAAFGEYVDVRMELLGRLLSVVDERLGKNPEYLSPVNGIVRPRVLDHCGALCAAMMRSGQSRELRLYTDRILDFIRQGLYRLPDGTIARNKPYENILWLDDLYMSVPALCEAYRQTGSSEYVDDAIRQIVQFARRMQLPDSSLFMHSWVEAMDWHPAWCWGRANGWATLAMCDLLDVLPEDYPGRAEVLTIFRRHCAALVACQSGEGLWHQLLDRNDSYLESSATAMFVYGLAHGINQGWLDARAFGPAALLGWNALGAEINNMGQIEKVCVGTGVSYEPAYYYNRHVHPYAAHGFGPVLMAGSEILDLIDGFEIRQSTAIYFYNRKKTEKR